jgi:hypothetical protein
LKIWNVAESRKHIATPKKNVEKTIMSAVLADPYRGRISRKTNTGRVKKRIEPKICDHMLMVSLCICIVVANDCRKEFETGLYPVLMYSLSLHSELAGRENLLDIAYCCQSGICWNVSKVIFDAFLEVCFEPASVTFYND